MPNILPKSSHAREKKATKKPPMVTLATLVVCQARGLELYLPAYSVDGYRMTYGRSNKAKNQNQSTKTPTFFSVPELTRASMAARITEKQTTLAEALSILVRDALAGRLQASCLRDRPFLVAAESTVLLLLLQLVPLGRCRAVRLPIEAGWSKESGACRNRFFPVAWKHSALEFLG